MRIHDKYNISRKHAAICEQKIAFAHSLINCKMRKINKQKKIKMKWKNQPNDPGVIKTDKCFVKKKKRNLQ